MGAESKTDYSWIGQTGSALGNVFGSIFGSKSAPAPVAPPSNMMDSVLPIAVVAVIGVIGYGVVTKKKR